MKLRSAVAGAVLGAWLSFPFVAVAHPELELQIEELSRQIAENPADADLYLRRADVHRRHVDWSAAQADFLTVRQLQPDRAETDWLEGRMLVESGQAEAGEALLTQFLSTQPDHPIALQSRARARLALDRHALAAEDFGAAVASSAQPSPELFRAWALSQAAVGKAYWPQAQVIVQSGLERFPREISLLGLDVDLSLVLESPDRSQKRIEQIPTPILQLPQWQYRLGLYTCLRGQTDRSRLVLEALLESLQGATASPGGNFDLPGSNVEALIKDIDPAACRLSAQLWVEQTIDAF